VNAAAVRSPLAVAAASIVLAIACAPEARNRPVDDGTAPAVAPAGEAESPAAEPGGARIEFGAMGTEVVIEAEAATRDAAERLVREARAEFDRVEDLMTTWRDSPLTRLNEVADGSPVEVPPELAALVARALTIARLSGGAFEPTFLGVGRLWDFKADPPVLPGDGDLEAALANVGWDRVRVDLEASTVAMPAGTRIGLGGIAKGYGVDRAMQVLVDGGATSGIVNAGGDLKALGAKDGRPWEIAIKHPRERERAIAIVPVSNVALVTSGDYERFFEVEGERFHHILDPRDGRPARGCMSATVTAPDAALADAVATALCVLGPEVGLELVERLPRVEALVVGMDGEVSRSSGLAERTR